MADLPQICFDPALFTRPSSTPPRGRNRISSKRKRSSSRSPAKDEDQHASKTIKLPDVSEIDPEKKIDETETSNEDDTRDLSKANMNDAGQFREHISYSPARPAPSKHSMITTTPGHLSKIKQPKLSYKPLQQSSKGKLDFQWVLTMGLLLVSAMRILTRM